MQRGKAAKVAPRKHRTSHPELVEGELVKRCHPNVIPAQAGILNRWFFFQRKDAKTQ
jgi:hypothetical protein